MITKGFKKRKVHSLTLGEKMKKLRETKRVTLHQVSRHTKIQERYLQDLEEGTYSDLPADVYVRGFLKSYAEYFSVNDATLIRLYNRERGIYNSISDEDAAVATQTPLKVKRFIVTPRMMVVAIGVALFSIVFFYLYSELQRFVSAPWLIVDHPTEGSTINDRVVAVRGTTNQDARVFVNSQGVIVNQDGSFEEMISLQNGINTIAVKSVNSFDKETQSVITVYGQYQEVQNDDELSPQQVTVEIIAQENDITVIIQADEATVFEGEILADQSQTFKASEKITITTDQGNATFVVINGKEYGLLGTTTEPVDSAVLTADSLRGEGSDGPEDEEVMTEEVVDGAGE